MNPSSVLAHELTDDGGQRVSANLDPPSSFHSPVTPAGCRHMSSRMVCEKLLPKKAFSHSGRLPSDVSCGIRALPWHTLPSKYTFQNGACCNTVSRPGRALSIIARTESWPPATLKTSAGVGNFLPVMCASSEFS